jgi:RNA polymerase sigma-70 factor (ECF subfamily)
MRTIATRRVFTFAATIPAAAALAAAFALAGCGRDVPQLNVSAAPPAQPPHVVAFDPPDGATDVDPSRTRLAVTFDRPMDPQGWAWVIEGPDTAPDLGDASFDASGTTNTVAAHLEPGRTYVVWINSTRYDHFRDRSGTPAVPVRWTFTTRSATAPAVAPAIASAETTPAANAAPRETTPAADVAPRPAPDAPHVIALEPPNGATQVDAASVTVLRATFDRPMEGSWSWVREGGDFPETTGSAYFEEDGRTAALPVRLEPGRTYVVWLNSSRYQLFRDASGTPAPPLRWSFSTAGARR